MREVTVVTPTGCIGNRGICKEAFEETLDSEKPHCIAVDAGSLDCGPWYLGHGLPHSPISNIRWDIDVILSEAVPRKIPVVIGSAGGSGAKPNVDLTLRIVKEVAKKRNLDFRLASIYADIDKEYLIQRIKSGEKIRKVPVSIFGEELLRVEDVEMCTNIVAMMGMEPLIEALKRGADVVIAGRAVDSAVIAAYPVMMGFDPALALHMGDIMECAESALVDVEGVTRRLGPNRISIVGVMREKHFLLKAGHPGMICTTSSACAHGMYERESSLLTEFPNGVLDKRESKFEQYDEAICRVSGAKLVEKPYTVLLEGAGLAGWRTITVLGVRNPVMISQIDEILTEAKRREEERFQSEGRFGVYYHVYGKNGVLGDYEPEKGITSHELGIVVDVVGESQQLAHEVCEDLALRIAFWRYKGRTTTAGNVAYLFSPNVVDVGEAFTTAIYHQMALEDPLELFPMAIESVKEHEEGVRH